MPPRAGALHRNCSQTAVKTAVRTAVSYPQRLRTADQRRRQPSDRQLNERNGPDLDPVPVREGRAGTLPVLNTLADTTRGSLGYSRLLRLANDSDAAAAEEESALVPVHPTYAVVDPFAGTQHLKDLSLTRGLPTPPRLENQSISDLALNHRWTSSRGGVGRPRVRERSLRCWVPA